MARGTVVYQQAIGSVAAYKGIYQNLSIILNQAATRTADTGQVNWATVSTESSAVRDYEVFALGGPLQASAPVYIRCDYIGGGSVGAGVSVTIGTTTDGAGNIGGLSVAKLSLQFHAIGTQANLSAWAACDGEYFTFQYALDPLATGTDGVGILVVERTRDPDGTANNAGFHVWQWRATSATATAYQGGWSKTFAAQTQTVAVDYNLTFVPDINNTNSAFIGSTSYAFPAYTYTPPFLKGASKALLLGFPADFPRGTAITVTHYGQAMTFVPLGDAVVNNQAMLTSATANGNKALSPLIRWD